MKNLIQNLIKDSPFAEMQRIGLLCNQVSFDFISQQYLFQILSKSKKLKRLFVPEHGLFGELQDQEKLNEPSVYDTLGLQDAEVVSLYQHNEKLLAPEISHLTDLDAIVIDIQDVGCRYFTFTSTIFYLFESLVKHNLSPKIFILNRSNPAGRQVEGIPISAKYVSFIGLQGLPHRHGMNMAELCFYFQEKLNSKLDIRIINGDTHSTINPVSINPSPNIPNQITPLIYSGQCLFEGTTLSEGRGTTRPFEMIGSPEFSWQEISHVCDKINKDWAVKAVLRPLKFIPTFHKFVGEVCTGFQLHLLDTQNYHSLLHSLNIIRELAQIKEDLWRKGKYEFGSEKTAIELLVGDDDLLGFLYGCISLKTIKEKLKESENQWIVLRNRINFENEI